MAKLPPSRSAHRRLPIPQLVSISGTGLERLPPELLAEIFTTYVGSSTPSDIRTGLPILARVCKFWKNIIYSTPALWAVIDFQIQRDILLNFSDRTMVVLKQWLDRSRQAPLRISISSDFSLTSPIQQDAVSAYLRTLLLHQERWSCASIHIATNSLPFFNGCKLQSLPLLRDLKVHFVKSHPDDLAFLRTAVRVSPNLRRLTDSSPGVPILDIPVKPQENSLLNSPQSSKSTLASENPFRHLTILKLSNYIHPSIAQRIVARLGQSLQIFHLGLYEEHRGPGYNTMAPTSTWINFSTNFSPLSGGLGGGGTPIVALSDAGSGPRQTRCYARELKVVVRGDVDMQQFFETIAFPNLSSFELVLKLRPSSRQQVLNSPVSDLVALPKIQTSLRLFFDRLALHGSNGGSSSFQSSFTVINLFVSPDALLDTLEIFSPSLTRLSIRAERPPSLSIANYNAVENVTDLVISALKYDPDHPVHTILLPKLTHLELERCVGSDVDDGRLSDMVASRWKIGYAPLHKLAAMFVRESRMQQREMQEAFARAGISRLEMVDVVFRYHTHREDADRLEGFRAEGLGGKTTFGYPRVREMEEMDWY